MVRPSSRLLTLLAVLAFLALSAAWWAWVPGLVAVLFVVLVLAARSDLRTLRAAFSQVTVRREFPERGAQGETVDVALFAENRSTIPLRLHVQDGPPAECPSRGDFASWLVRPGETVRAMYSMRLPVRGVMAFQPMFLRFRSSLGLLWYAGTWSSPDEIRVYPPIWKAVEADARLRAMTLGNHVQPLRGGGGDFDSLRPYVAGDDYRKMDWKATAKRGVPMVREYGVERNQFVLVGVDTGRWMRQRLGDRTKLDYALPAALQLARASVELSDTVGFFLYGAKVRHFVPPGRGLLHFNRMVDLAFGIQPVVEEPDYASIFHTVLARVMRRSVIVLFTDFAGQDRAGEFARHAALLRPKHLPFMAAISDGTILQAVTRSVESSQDIRIKAAAGWTRQRTVELLQTLRGLGCQVLETHAQTLEAEAMARFIALRRRLH